jgi:hypothetical protein
MRFLSLLSSAVLVYASAASSMAQAQVLGEWEKKPKPAPGQDPTPSEPESFGETTVGGNSANKSGVFLGGGLSFGQARPTAGGAPGMVFAAHFEPGYQVKTGSWSRVEVGADIFSGSASFKNDDGKSQMQLGLGLLVKAGYGYSLGSGMFGVMKIGLGPVMAKYKGEFQGADVESDSVTGLATQLAYIMVFPVSSTLDFTGGFSYTHMQFNIDEVKAGSVKADFDPVGLNLPQAELGLRVRL